ncbi:MAG: hypothetical protein ACPG7U_02100 [Holosporaceae bacterium]
MWAPKRPREEDSTESDSIANRVRKRRRTDGSSVATPSPPQSPPKQTDNSFAAWFAKLTDAQKRQTCPEIEEMEAAFNSFVQDKVVVDSGFSFENLIVRDDASRATVVARYHAMPASLVSEDLPILAWHEQSAREAFGGSIFLNLALDKPHRLMVMHALRPLFEFAQKKKELSAALVESRTALDEVLEDHPYTRRRFGLYALALSTRFHNPIAALVLERAMHRLCPDRPSNTLQIMRTEIERSLQVNASSISLLGDWAQTTLYANLKGDDLKAEALLKEKLDLGLVHYAVPLGRLVIKSRDEWSEEKSKKRRDYYEQAANGFDAQACHRLARWYHSEAYRENGRFARTQYRYPDKAKRTEINRKGQTPFHSAVAHGHEAAWKDDRLIILYMGRNYEFPEHLRHLFDAKALFKNLKRRLRHLRPPNKKQVSDTQKTIS